MCGTRVFERYLADPGQVGQIGQVCEFHGAWLGPLRSDQQAGCVQLLSQLPLHFWMLRKQVPAFMPELPFSHLLILFHCAFCCFSCQEKAVQCSAVTHCCNHHTSRLQLRCNPGCSYNHHLLEVHPRLAPSLNTKHDTGNPACHRVWQVYSTSIRAG